MLSESENHVEANALSYEYIECGCSRRSCQDNASTSPGSHVNKPLPNHVQSLERSCSSRQDELDDFNK